MKNTRSLNSIFTIACIAMMSFSCSQEEKTPLASNPSKIFTTVQAQTSAKITGFQEDLISISSEPAPTVATANLISSGDLYIIGEGVGNTSVTIEAEGHDAVIIPITVAQRKFTGGFIKPTIDGFESYWNQGISAWDSLGIFSLHGYGGSNDQRSVDMKDVTVFGNGTFTLPAGKVTFTDGSATYTNTGTSFDILTISSYTSSRLTGAFRARFENVNNPSDLVEITQATFEMF